MPLWIGPAANTSYLAMMTLPLMKRESEALLLISKAILPAQLSWHERLMRPESPERIMFPKRRP